MDRFWIAFKKGKGSGGGQAKKGKKGGGNSSSSSDQSDNKKGAGRGRGKGRGGGAKKDAYSAYNTPKPPTPKPDAEWSAGSGGGAVEVFRPPVASGHLGQICPRDGVQRLQDRIHSQAPDNVEGVVEGHPQEPLSKRGSRKRAPVHAGQTSHKGNPGVARNARVLLPDFPGIQGIGWLKADSKPQGFQQIRSAPILSDGDTANSHGLPGGGGPTKAEHLRTFEGLKSIRNVGDLDLRDTYFHVAVAQEHTRYLRFAYNGRAFEFLVLPFGLSTAPRVFTRIVRVIEAFLKIQGVDMHQYLDDWLMKNQSKSLVERHRDLTLFWVNKLGFLVNEGKSQLIPTQAPAFLGSTLDLLNMLVFPSERIILRATRLAASLLARTAQPAKTW